MRSCICPSVHASMNACIHGWMHARMPACLHACKPACLQACMPASLHASMYARTHAGMHLCLHPCMHLSIDPPSNRLFVRPPARPSAHPSAHPSVYGMQVAGSVPRFASALAEWLVPRWPIVESARHWPHHRWTCRRARLRLCRVPIGHCSRGPRASAVYPGVGC